MREKSELADEAAADTALAEFPAGAGDLHRPLSRADGDKGGDAEAEASCGLSGAGEPGNEARPIGGGTIVLADIDEVAALALVPVPAATEEENPNEESNEPAEKMDACGELEFIVEPDAADERAANEVVSRMRFDCFQNLSEPPPPPPPPPPPMSTLDRSAPRPALRMLAEGLADRPLCGDCLDEFPPPVGARTAPKLALTPKSSSSRFRLAATTVAAMVDEDEDDLPDWR